MSVVSMKSLLEAGVHFGHQTKRWNPKMKPYIYTERNGIYIIDLQKSLKKLEEAYEFVRDLSSQGKKILYVGTKKQAREAIEQEAKRAGMFYVNQSWKGGLLTNFATIRKRIEYLFELEEMEEDGTFENLPKKEVMLLTREKEKLHRIYDGIRDMDQLPDAVFVIDQVKEKLAIHEARLLGIPVIGIVDTNCDPDQVDYPIPGNDDAIRAIKLFSNAMTNAVIEGKAAMEAEDDEEMDEPAEEIEDESLPEEESDEEEE
ncbi:MAG: 30S ribosomal protein S2 [Tissierellia bacterium]|nr:30S ribosomal protein S2 [Bacillota bacterium]NLL22210.1 30S ribosomal protein S2 [Tissierellia bacterium]